MEDNLRYAENQDTKQDIGGGCDLKFPWFLSKLYCYPYEPYDESEQKDKVLNDPIYPCLEKNIKLVFYQDCRSDAVALDGRNLQDQVVHMSENSLNHNA